MNTLEQTTSELKRFAYELEDCYRNYGTIMMSGCFSNTPDVIGDFIVARPYLEAILGKFQILGSYGVSVMVTQTGDTTTFTAAMGGNDDKTAPANLQLVVDVTAISQPAWELSMADPQARKTMELTAAGIDLGSPYQADKVYCLGNYRAGQRLPLTANAEHSLLNTYLVNAIIVSFNELAKHSGTLSSYIAPSDDGDGKLVFTRYQKAKDGYAKVLVSLVLGSAYRYQLQGQITLE